MAPYKKQVLMMQLLMMLLTRKGREQAALRALFPAQKLVSELDESSQRNFDYIVSVNCLTAFVLLRLQQPQDAVEFVGIAEKAILWILDRQSQDKKDQAA